MLTGGRSNKAEIDGAAAEMDRQKPAMQGLVNSRDAEKLAQAMKELGSKVTNLSPENQVKALEQVMNKTLDQGFRNQLIAQIDKIKNGGGNPPGGSGVRNPAAGGRGP